MKGKILIVDDNPNNLSVLESILIADGHEVRAAISGEVALKTLASRLPELILVDIMMPGMDGFEVCKRLKSDPATAAVPVLFISALSETENKLSAFEAGGVDYISKPFAELEVLARVRTHLKLHRMEMDLQSQISEAICDREKAYNDLSHLNDELEQRVSERTVQLESANEILKTTYRQLVQQEKMASIGQLAAGVAHEINNPMGFITSNLSTLGKYLERLTEFITLQEAAARGEAPEEAVAARRKELKLDWIQKDSLELIAESLDGAERIKKIVQDLKGFSRVDQADNDYADLNQCLESSMNIVRNTLKFKANLVKELGDIPQIKCWPRQLGQVFINLLVNAANAIDTFGDIFVKSWSEDGNIFVSIADTGCGIPDANLEKIFEPFFTTKEVGEGTGLGLSISYDIIKKHNGEILVESELGKGTRFLIRLPVSESVG